MMDKSVNAFYENSSKINFIRQVLENELKKNNKQAALFILTYRIGNFAYYFIRMRIIRALVLFIAKILNVLVINILFSSYLPMSTKINIGLEIGHPRGIVINAHSIVGSNCRLEHQVTLGQNNGLFPQLGNNVYVGSGAKIIGGAYIFDNSKVGANAVVNKRFNEPSLLVGVPAVQKKIYN